MVIALLAIVHGYGVAGLVGALVPVNAGSVPASQGVRIYVEDNGIHTGIVVPVAAEGIDWGEVVRPEHLRDRRYAAYGWRSFGWGGREFYLNTPTWWDVNPLTITKSAVGLDGSVMHVDAVPQPRVGPSVRSIVLTPDQYRRLSDFIRSSFAEGPPQFGYGGWDAFYPAHGRYSAIRTCNAWTGEALRHAGVRMGAWTPFPVTVMTWLPAN